MARSDPRILDVVNDSEGSTELGAFHSEFPGWLVNVDIAGQVMMGVNAGLANCGFVPFASTASCFPTGRALEQVKADIAYTDFNVKLIGQSSGVANGKLGRPTNPSRFRRSAAVEQFDRDHAPRSIEDGGCGYLGR